MNELERRKEEFFRFVWNHSEDPFLLAFELRRPLSDDELGWLFQVYEACFFEDEAEAVESIRKLIKDEGSRVTALLIQIAGLTRNKVITDLRASLGRGAPRSYENLHRQASGKGIQYVLRRLRQVFGPLRHLDAAYDFKTIRFVLESLNQATYPGYIRQERAKRQGHEAERRLAVLLNSLNIPFVPIEKLDNPLSRDIQLEGISFDLIVPDTKSPKILVKSTVQTANIGQFGESKSALE